MDISNISHSMKLQLMQMAGMTDVGEFDQFVAQMRLSESGSPASNATRPLLPQEKPRSIPKGGLFHEYFLKATVILEAAGLDTFTALNSDLGAQLRYVDDLISSDGDLRQFPQGSTAQAPDLTSRAKSKAIREKGNKAYVKKDLTRALDLFSQAAFATEGCDDPATGLAIGNRSAVHFDLGQLDQCLGDIEASLRYLGYPTHLAYKLLDRKARCLLQRSLDSEGERISAEKACREAIASMMAPGLNLSPDRRDAMKADLERAMLDKLGSGPKKGNRDTAASTRAVDFQAKRPHDVPVKVPGCPFEIWDRNGTFPSLASSLSVAYNTQVGRHVLASANIEAGEVIAIEEAISVHLSPYQSSFNCHHCLKHIGGLATVLPSPVIRKVKFCSVDCLSAAMETYHVTESKVDLGELFYTGDKEEDDSTVSGCIFLAYRVVTQKSLEYFLTNRSRLLEDYDPAFGVEAAPGYVYTGDEFFKGLLNLVSHQDKMTPNERMSFCIRTVALLRCLRRSGFFSTHDGGHSSVASVGGVRDEGLEDQEVLVAEILFRLQIGIQYNLHAIYEVEGKLEAGKRIPLRDIGAGVYPTTLFLNHSCCPNTMRINQGSRVILVAKRRILRGEEVSDCYGTHHLSMEKQERQSKLVRGYAFECQCEACDMDYPTISSGRLPNQVSPAVAKGLGNSLSRYKEAFSAGKAEKALNICREYLRKMADLKVAYPHMNYEISAIALCSCLWALVQNSRNKRAT